MFLSEYPTDGQPPLPPETSPTTPPDCDISAPGTTSTVPGPRRDDCDIVPPCHHLKRVSDLSVSIERKMIKIGNFQCTYIPKIRFD